MARKEVAFLVYRARDGDMRIVKRAPDLRWDEIAFRVTVTVPDPWGKFAGAIEVELPEGGPALVGVQLVPPPEPTEEP